MENQFITVPARTLSNGKEVPAFVVGKYLCSRSENDIAVVSESTKPWVRIDYHAAKQACLAAGFKLITESQYLSLALDIASQDINWTGGKVGEGDLFQGLRKWSVEEAQAGDYVPPDENERRWFQLSNGERIYDAAGNAFTWVFDDIQGDDTGLVSREFATNSPSIDEVPYPPLERGTGWRPSTGNWSGYALVRGGYWYSEGDAGVFHLDLDWPDYSRDRVGFRCTK